MSTNQAIDDRGIRDADARGRRVGEPLTTPPPAPAARLQRLLHAHPLTGPALVLVLACVLFSLLIGPRFYQPANLSLVVQQVQIIGMVGVAQTLVILTAGIDLSVAAIMVFTTVVAARLAVGAGVPAALALLAGFAAGAACGAVNGLLVTRFRVPPFIATLGTLNVFGALTLLVSGSQTVRGADLPALFLWPGQTFSAFGADITYGSALVLVAFLFVAHVLRRTAWGEHVHVTGDTLEGARLSGIRTDRVLLSVYVIAGLICAVAGWFLIGRVGSVSPFSGENVNLSSITAVVIGGTSLFGGRGHVAGTLLGALIVGVFSNGLTLAGVDVLWQTFTIGVLVVAAVGVDQWTRRVGG
ncbi:MAG: ABC transporter permease [Microbispora sp.]|nr:ABC transporter permease [Microbispora sp.]